MWRTVLFLIFTLLVIPVLTYFYDVPLNDVQIDTFKILLAIYGISVALTFVTSTITKNYGQVDKVWSTIPILYTWVIAYHSGYDLRIVLMALLVTIWGLRLTYNFARRGGFSWKFWAGEEDYRWPVLREKPEFQGAMRWTLFNLFFISGYQLGLILLFCLPALKVMTSEVPIGWIDYTLTSLMLVVIYIEWLADEQQYIYQEAKYKLIREGKKLSPSFSKGFTHNGLWAYMSHPNYGAEQLFWVLFYIFSIVATGTIVNWSIAGCVLLLILFKGSADFSEEISAGKYPEYQRYIDEVGRFLPIKGKYKG